MVHTDSYYHASSNGIEQKKIKLKHASSSVFAVHFVKIIPGNFGR